MRGSTVKAGEGPWHGPALAAADVALRPPAPRRRGVGASRVSRRAAPAPRRFAGRLERVSRRASGGRSERMRRRVPRGPEGEKSSPPPAQRPSPVAACRPSARGAENAGGRSDGRHTANRLGCRRNITARLGNAVNALRKSQAGLSLLGIVQSYVGGELLREGREHFDC